MYLLFEIGGTKTRIGISADGRSIEKSQIIPTPKDFEQFISELKQVAVSLVGTESVKALAGGIAGVLDTEKGVLIKGPHLQGLVDKPLKETLQNVFKASVFLENDATLGGLGEAVFGAGQGKGIVAYITVGTGIGGTRIVNGSIDSKVFGFEPGHQIINPEGLELEDWVSGEALKKEHGISSENIDDPIIWDEAAKRLALGLANTIMHWSPDILILGGGLMQKIPLENLKTYIKEYLKIYPTPPEITLSKLGELSGLWGALEYIRQNQT